MEHIVQYLKDQDYSLSSTSVTLLLRSSLYMMSLTALSLLLMVMERLISSPEKSAKLM